MRSSRSTPSLSTHPSESSAKQPRLYTLDALALPTVFPRYPLWCSLKSTALATIGLQTEHATSLASKHNTSHDGDLGRKTADIGLLFVKKDGTYGSEEEPTQDFYQTARVSERVRSKSSPIRSDFESALSSEPDVEARRLEETVTTLLEENTKLRRAKNTLEQNVALLQDDLATWKAKVRDAQSMQEMAMAAFQRHGALEAENLELKHVVLAFTKGSSSEIVQGLHAIIRRLSTELELHRRREADLSTKENGLKDAEHTSILNAMRSQTSAIKVRRIYLPPLTGY
ncbi:hypothetical protein B0H21DRAFT_705621 [Amylocystis lapponica]|nr:hypothetical protein B0H21DRAFT_705621 [Amylocystis lapponica]